MDNSALPAETPAQVVERLFGGETLQYVKNKHTGGESGQKGFRYQDLFAAAKVSELAAQHLKSTANLPTLAGEVFGFVDDFVVKCATTTDYYQCKDVKSIAWGNSTKSLSGDFSNQFRYSEELNEPAPKTHLVLSDPKLALDRQQDIPANILKHTTVIHFPHLTALGLVKDQKFLRTSLAALSAAPEGYDDQLEGVLKALLLAWITTEPCSLDAILISATKQSPQLLVPYPPIDVEEYILPGFRSALAHIPDLTYDVNRGFLSWRGSFFSGTMTQDCSSPEFQRFQQQVIKAQPKTVIEFLEQFDESQVL